MLRTLDVRRRARRMVAGICALAALGLLPLLALCARADAALARTALAEAAARHVLATRGPAAATRRDPETLETEAGDAVHAYPPLDRATSSAPVAVMLHGMCSNAKNLCDYLRGAGREGSWLVCPEGNGRCGEWSDWTGSGEEKAAFLDEGLRAVRRAYGGEVARAGGDVLMGFSRGAFVARDVIYARPGRYRGAILIGAALDPDPARFKAAGVRRVVMAAGQYDGARGMMERSVARLSAAGLPARFVNLGRIGHQLPEDIDRVLADALAWVRADDPA